MATIAQLDPLRVPKFDAPPTMAELDAADAEAKNARAVADFNTAKATAAKDAEARAKRLRQLAQETGGDFELMLSRLRAEDPEGAVAFEESIAKQRGEAFKTGKAQLEMEALEAEQGAAYLRTVIGLEDDAAYQALRPVIQKRLPELAAVLPPTYDRATLERFLTTAETQKDYNTRTQAALALLVEGKFHSGLGLALSTAESAEQWNETKAGHKALGTPQAVLDDFGEWQGPQSKERAAKLAMTPDDRADNAREDQKFEYGKTKDKVEQGFERDRIGISRGLLGVAQGNLAVRRDEVKAERASGGTENADVKAYADAWMAGTATPEAMEGLNPLLAGKVGAEVLRRGGKLWPKAAAGGAKAGGPNFVAILSEIDTLSRRINTQGAGPGSNVAGATRRGMAAMNLDNDVAEYESLVLGMIPMVARAVGHTGQLTQQDVDSVRALFPQVGDNETLARNKLARVKSLIGAAAGAAPAAAAPAAAPAAGAGGAIRFRRNPTTGKLERER
jgi:hypothetical protein